MKRTDAMVERQLPLGRCEDCARLAATLGKGARCMMCQAAAGRRRAGR